MYIVKIDTYYLETLRSIKNTVNNRENVSNASERLVCRKETASKYSLQFAQYLANKYKKLNPMILKGE